MHPVLGWLEPLKPPEYSQVMRDFRDDFESIKPFRDWNSHLKETYNQRIREIVKSWRANKEIPSLGITQKWIKDEESKSKTYEVALLDGRIIGEVNVLSREQYRGVEFRNLSIREFIDYIINHIADKLGI
ncbi:MAG: hypothetical protein CEE43_12415 [Promethearchaeota archaeon Loki_b32]|nr:MAG: hypothetical protein CEE43_12415 [Candidatus Lokiarchaeota archaeon Loki_b32]